MLDLHEEIELMFARLVVPDVVQGFARKELYVGTGADVGVRIRARGRTDEALERRRARQRAYNHERYERERIVDSYARRRSEAKKAKEAKAA